MRPYKIESPSEFVQVFGNPVAGAMGGGDIWREGNLTGPTYGSYAAMAYLKANVGPITMFRLLGEQYPGTLSVEDAAKAGWTTKDTLTSAIGGGAYGIFVFNSSSAPGSDWAATGTLGAVIYVNSGSIALRGTALSSSTNATDFEGYGTVMESQGDDTQIEFRVYESSPPASGTPAYRTSINFNRDSPLFIRNVLNTNPQLTNENFVASGNLNQGENLYWLGETFEQDVKQWNNGSFSEKSLLLLLPLQANSDPTKKKSDYKMNFAYAKTGYFYSQDLSDMTGSYDPDKMTKLFRVAALDGGRWTQDKFKVSIKDIKAGTSDSDPYGSFSVVLRAASDTDNVVQVVEQFSNVNLNPASENYIARVIGDTYYEFDYVDGRVLRQYGQYTNKSKYIRVDMNPDVDQGLMDARLLPFGVSGPLRFKEVNYTTGSTIAANRLVDGSGSSPGPNAPDDCTSPPDGIWMGDTNVPLSGLRMKFPSITTRKSASDGGLSDPTDAYFGLQTTQGSDSLKFDQGFGDYLWRLPASTTKQEDTLGEFTDDWVAYSWTNSLDDVVTTGSNTAYHVWNARKDGISATAIGSWKTILEDGYDRITAPLYGGFDGLDIKEAEPFRNSFLSVGDNLDTANYAFNSIKRAIDTVKDPEFVECNVMTIPGVTNNSLTQHLLNTCEDRADALAIIDLPDVYTPFTDSTEDFYERNQTSLATCITNLTERQLNTSYGCTYYPWVQILDTISNNLLWVPPSVVALGTLASSEAKSEVWFAPAGFNRGGLTEGAAGWPVTNITRRLTSKDRDKLYEVNVNPIATFPSEGIVVFGQKTLQVTRSALDRINVRRLLIYIKKQVSRIASGILFDQNVQVTWNRFLGEVQPFLASIQARLGLSEWKVILDDTTTTPDLIDQNIMYAKIFLKPARAIEFIAVDFVITRTGASFDD
jgi:hypothetical protein